jgi:Asp-tRNA(Asn)/Glu-tRNA(Gln) amidotransferase B subunit
MGFFTREVMQATSGKANGKDVAAELRRRRS